MRDKQRAGSSIEECAGQPGKRLGALCLASSRVEGGQDPQSASSFSLAISDAEALEGVNARRAHSIRSENGSSIAFDGGTAFALLGRAGAAGDFAAGALDAALLARSPCVEGHFHVASKGPVDRSAVVPGLLEPLL
jgi:hypothetical protein